MIEELFTGRLLHGSPGDPKNLRRDAVSPDVAALIARLKSDAPSHRPTADDVVERLAWISDAPRRLRRRLVIAAVLVLAVAGAAKYTWDLARERAAAVAARDEANRRREQAEGLIGFMVGDLRTRLTSVGRLDLLDDVGQKALEYFATVPADSLTGEERYRRSQTLHQLGQVRQARADLPGALKAYEESLALAQAVVAMDPGNAAWQLGLGTSHFYVGDMKRRSGDLDGALVHLRAYQEIAKRLVERDPNNLEWKLELSYGYSNVAAILSGRGQFAAAREQLELTRDLQTEIARVKPDDTTIQTSRANNFNRLGVVLQRLGQLEPAAVSFAREMDIYRELSAKDPLNTQFRRRIPTSSTFLGQARRAIGDPAGALETLLAGLDVANGLVAHDPANADWQRALAFSEMYVGRLLVVNGDPRAGLARFQAARAILDRLATRPNAGAAAALDAIQSGYNVADTLAVLGQRDAATRETEAAIQRLMPVVAKNPRDVVIVRTLANCHSLRARIAQTRGEPERARQHWSRAVELLAPFARDGTDYVVIDPWVRALVLLGRADEAQAGFDRLSSFGYKDREFLKFWNEHAR